MQWNVLVICFTLANFLVFANGRSFLGRLSSLSEAELQGKFPVIEDRVGSTPMAFQAYPAALEDGEDVVISWSGVPKAYANDFVSISCGPTLGLDDYLDKLQISAASVTSGSGSVRFPYLVMMRCNYDFYYMNCASSSSCQALAHVSVPMRESLLTPYQGHLAFTSEPDEMAVSFVSSLNFPVPVVKYGVHPAYLEHRVEGGTSVTYQAADMCNYPANYTRQMWFRDPGYIHHVVLKGLRPSTRYYYQFGNDKIGWSPVHSFLSRASSEGVSAHPVTKFIAYADMGDWDQSSVITATRVFSEVESGFDNFLLHFGDISYARGAAWNWEVFFQILEPYATTVPYMVSIGNHEYDHVSGGQHDPSGVGGAGWHPSWGNMGDDSNGECAVPMYYRFVTPKNGNALFWYSFDYGAVHVIQMSSEHDWTRGSTQYKWIEKDLASVNRTKTPWVVLTSHRMMYTTQLEEDADYIVSEHFKQEMDDLINDYGVNLMLTGHQHSYERSCPVYKRACVESGKATVHIVTGTAGAGLESGGFSPSLGNWSLVQDEAWGYCRLTADANSLFVEFIENDTGSVFDEVTLKPWFGNKKERV